MKAGQGYNFLKADNDPIYYETKIKYQELYQPIKEVDATKDLKEFSMNDISKTFDPSYRINASYYNELIGKGQEKPYGTEVYFHQSYPNHFYNTQKFSPIFVALNQNK